MPMPEPRTAPRARSSHRHAGLRLLARALPALLLALLFTGCADDPVPKPRGYFRIDLPPDSTRTVEAPCPFTAEVPVYARLETGPNGGADGAGNCRTDLFFPGQRAAVHMTWRRLQGDLPQLIREAHVFKEKHQVLATRIKEEQVIREHDRVFGTLFALDGNVASPMMFYLTDSVSNFLYGALYFDVRPNADSLAPVTDRIRSDIRALAHSLRWELPAGVVEHVQ